MKFKFFKYIFMLFVIGIFIYAVYILYFKDKPLIEEEKTANNVAQEVSYITNLELAISNFDTINPLISQNKEVLNISKIIFEPLVYITQDYKIKLNLAKECSKTSDTSYIIKINNNIKWQDGSQFEAKDIAFTINVLKQGKSVYSSNVEKIQSIEVIDKNTIKINLKEPVTFFEYYLTFPILPNDYYINTNFYTTSKIPIGTGMFAILEMTNESIKLVRNENWWNKEHKEAKIETIHIKIYGEVGEVYNSFKLGNVDLFTTYNTNLQNYIGTMGYDKEEVKGREFDYLAFNCQSKVLKHAEVRKALQFAIHKENIVSTVFNNNCYVSNYPLDYGSYLYNEEALNAQYNLEKAKDILLENGWEYKNNKWQKRIDRSIVTINLTITVNSANEMRVKVAENIKKQLQQIGINVNINKVSNSKYEQILKNKNYEMILTGVYNSFSPNLDLFFGEDNLQNYDNAEVKNVLKEVQNIGDELLLEEKYNRIMQIYNEQVPFVGLYRNKVSVVKSGNLIGEIDANNYFSYYGVVNWYGVE